MKTLRKKKNGYILVFLLFAVLFVALFFFPATYSEIPKGPDPGICVYNPPLTTDSFTDEGVTYDLIKKRASILAVQVELHMHLGKDIMVNGKMRKVTRTIAESDISNWSVSDETERPKWHDIRYVNVTDDVKSDIPGTAYIDIYIKRGTKIPNDILGFCKNNTAEWKSFFTDDDDKSFPPKEIDASKITGWECRPAPIPGVAADCEKKKAFAPRDGNYYLYAYDTNYMEPIGFVKRTQIMPVSSIYIEGKEYRVVFYGGWESKHIRLETTDPITGQEVGFRYANPARLTIPADPAKFLNVRKTEDNTLQLQTFVPFQIPPAGWWTPECKPAIYLYPKKAMQVNVKVEPKGFMTYTDPVYTPNTGWNVKAFPDGKLQWLDQQVGLNSRGEKRASNIYEYLYYESKIHDAEIEKPTEGFILKYADLPTFYQKTLPLLGLNEKETSDYINYWKDILPKSEYYFVGVMSQQSIDAIEPMTITPDPDKKLRVRLFYEPLSAQKAIDLRKNIRKPQLGNIFHREGFTAVEWGGMVKQDKDHPFTCSM